MKKIVLFIALMLIAAPITAENVFAKSVDKNTETVANNEIVKSAEEANFEKQEFAKMRADEAIKNAKKQNAEYKKAQKAAKKELQNLKRQRNEERLKYEKEMLEKQSVNTKMMAEPDSSVGNVTETETVETTEKNVSDKQEVKNEVKHNLQPQEPQRIAPKKDEGVVEEEKEVVEEQQKVEEVIKHKTDEHIENLPVQEENFENENKKIDEMVVQPEKTQPQEDITPTPAKKSDYVPVEKNKKETAQYKKQIKQAGLKFNEEDFVKQAELNKTEIVRTYLMAGMNPDAALKSNTTPLIWASFNGNIAMVKNLAEAGANVNVVNSDGFTPLHAAVESGNPNVVRYLLQRGAKINTATVKDGTTPLHTACYKGNREIVQILIVAGANIEAKTVHGATPLVTATFYGKKDIVECLKANGAKIDVESKQGEVLAKSAITANKTDSYEELVKAGADVNMADENGKTMLQAAVEKGDVKTVETLIKDGANVNVKCSYKESSDVTPLITAVITKNEAVIKPLLKSNVDLNAKEKNLGLTALQIAILQGNEDVAADLIFNGADINSLTNDGFTAADLALAKKDVSMLKKLVASGAMFGKNTGAELVKFGCSMNYDSTKSLYKIDANDAITAVLELEQTQNDEYLKYMEKSYSFRKEQGFALNNHILKVYRLLYEMIK